MVYTKSKSKKAKLKLFTNYKLFPFFYWERERKLPRFVVVFIYFFNFCFKHFQEVEVFVVRKVLEPETQQNGNAEQKSVILWCASKHYTWNYTFLMRQSFEILPRVVCRVKYFKKVLDKLEIFKIFTLHDWN